MGFGCSTACTERAADATGTSWKHHPKLDEE
jgi:hypothetical protein